MKHTFEVELIDGKSDMVIERILTEAKATRDAIREVGPKLSDYDRFRVVQVRTEVMLYQPAGSRVLVEASAATRRGDDLFDRDIDKLAEDTIKD